MAAPASSGPEIYVDDSLKADSLTNVYLNYGSKTVEGAMTLSYGSCEVDSEATHLIGTTEVTADFQPTKFAWAVPSDAQSGCIVAKDAAGNIIARSEPYTVSTTLSKRGHPEFEDMYFDAVKYHKRQMSKRSKIHASDKSEKIGIIGAGMSGLFSGLLLDQAGFHNYEILEANDRLGGRVHTTYFNNSTIAYQEMGPMRFPVSIDYEDGKSLPVTDHNIVFQMAEELNKMNDDHYKIEFIKWIQSSDNNLSYRNGVRLSDGRVPTKGQVAANSSLTMVSGTGDLSSAVSEATEEFYTDDWYKLMSKDLYKAHAKALDEGYDDWSEWAWLHQKSGLSLNATDYATGLSAGNIWEDLYDRFTFSATNWKTVQGGLNRLAKAYEPVLGDKVTFGRKVSKLAVEDSKVSVQWKEDPYDEKYKSESYDNVIVGVPFTIVRNWHLPELPYTLDRAIKNLGYSQACKVALEFSERFWEQYELPIKGGCDSTDLASGSICYPSNNFGSDGPGVMLASYASGDGGLRFASMTEEQHVARVLEDIYELHGGIAKEKYTGNYDRVCWILDEFQSGSWASAEPGQHKLYMPSYFEMSNGIVFVGEHTDIKHAWISAALESSIRGVVMVLVEHGHVKEAKQLVKKWNASWMKI
ncbi:putative amine oxidase [Zychaea mexicana]|uniref:putative amine oxidase n=1 Tax=Zychaea mexicana TaxID=64656 RepID=UPI0022FF1BCA|nr:putative amine oxidase [Zychaea mexicana]KAI9497202.1 putative amine oxidase [Zychaea mexicana]